MRAFKIKFGGDDLEVFQDADGKFLKPDFIRANESLGTALKPACEPIVLARKPLEKGLTVAQNVLKWGVGALNIDGARIEASDQAALEKNWDRTQSAVMEGGTNAFGKGSKPIDLSDRKPQGRWPANVLLDEEAAAVLGEPSRFFYVAKASKRERNAGLEGMPDMRSGTERMNNSDGRKVELGESDRLTLTKNGHPTVKPIKLMEYLVRLITPPNGIVLDPFLGSGSTLVACARLGFEGIGIEREQEYVEIARRRIEHAAKDKQLELEGA